MDEWAYWRGALALVGNGGKLTKAQVEQLGGITQEPCAGFWRWPVAERIDGKKVAKPSLPVAIWLDESEWRCLVDGKPEFPDAAWSWCAMCPITEDTYRRVAEAREWWPEGIT